jgi:TRAP-type C4-dicarboxylate transport system substrate-binding protein
MEKVNSVTTKQGVRVFALVPLGGMGGFAVTKETIKTPADFKGVRMRAMNNQQVEMYKAWGANSVVIPWSEIYNALQTGIADGYMNPPLVPIMFKHTELIKNFSVVNMSCGTRAIIASEDWYQGLSGKDKAVVDGAVEKASDTTWSWSIKVAEKSLQDLAAAGVNVYRNTSAEKAQFAKLVRPVYPEIVPQKVADYFVEIADKYR